MSGERGWESAMGGGRVEYSGGGGGVCKKGGLLESALD